MAKTEELLSNVSPAVIHSFNNYVFSSIRVPGTLPLWNLTPPTALEPFSLANPSQSCQFVLQAMA